ncbi:MAG: flagellar hook-length control protein FliK [Planctomycetes bacterium]|nr:flagellar hook-length control protein FliK [Planctomycetota bacterium]
MSSAAIGSRPDHEETDPTAYGAFIYFCVATVVSLAIGGYVFWSKGGQLAARMEAESAATRDLLIENLPLLRDRLAEQGIQVQRFEVDLMDQRGNDGCRAFDTANGNDPRRDRRDEPADRCARCDVHRPESNHRQFHDRQTRHGAVERGTQCGRHRQPGNDRCPGISCRGGRYTKYGR